MSYHKARLASEISDAILRGEVTHIKIDGVLYKLPSCQSAGKYWQRKSHADKLAVDFLDNIDAYKKTKEEEE